MKVYRLKEQQNVKNYKKLCNLLEVPVKEGKAKILQIKEFERFFRFHKISTCYVINEIYELEREKIDKRKDATKMGNNSKYSRNIQSLIIDLLAQSKNERLCLSVGALLDKLGMVNGNYLLARRNIPKLSELINVPESNCYDFYNYTQKDLKTKLESALNSLRRRALVMWTSELILCVKVSDAEINEYEALKLDSSVKEVYEGSTNIKFRTVHKKADRAEKRLVLRIENEVLSEMGFVTLQGVFLAGGWDIFKKRVHAKLWELGNIEYYYTAFEIVYNYDPIYNALSEEDRKAIETLELKERKEKQETLNTDICTATIGGALTRVNRTLSKVNCNKPIKDTDKILIDESYISHTETLTNAVISYKTAVAKSLESEDFKNAQQMSLLDDDLVY